MLTTYAIVAVIAYLLGSIPFGYILVRVFRGEDVRAMGSGNIGATNVARKAPGLGVLTLILDAAKGYAAVNVATLHAFSANRSSWEHAYVVGSVAALFAIVGHVFPVWLKFRGGKGVATGVGAFVALAAKPVLVVLGIFLVIVAASRYVSLGSISAAAAFPFCVYLLKGRAEYPAMSLVIVFAASLLIILKHHENIRRLLSGTENRFELKRTRA